MLPYTMRWIIAFINKNNGYLPQPTYVSIHTDHGIWTKIKDRYPDVIDHVMLGTDNKQEAIIIKKFTNDILYLYKITHDPAHSKVYVAPLMICACCIEGMLNEYLVE